MSDTRSPGRSPGIASACLSRLVRKFGDVLPTTASPAIPMPDVIMHHGAIILTQRHREHGGTGGM
jgi:hypothetical protein